MRRISLTIFAVFSILFCVAQTPQALNYQGVARNGLGQIIPSQNISVRFSILDGSNIGTVVFQETHSVTTNNFGLFTLGIGRGTVTIGTFAGIAWETGNKYLTVEVAPQGGNNYTLQGTTQLLSVPYALYAERTRLIAGNNTITINGNTIMGNYQPANNTITITGNLIGGNYQAGTGINITGNVISATGGSNLWVSDPDGIHNQSGRVGIGGNSSTVNNMLNIVQQATGGFSSAMVMTSNDVFHTVYSIQNTTLGINNRFSWSLGGSTNTEILPGNFGLFNHSILKYAIKINGSNNFVGIGMLNGSNTETPRSKLHVFGGDINIEQIGSGIIMKSPNGQCWRVTIDNTGALVTTAIACP